MPKIHVTGLGGVTGIAPSLEASLDAMFAENADQLCAPRPFTRIPLAWGRDSILAFSEHEPCVPPKGMESVNNRTSQLGGYAAQMALSNAGLSLQELDGVRVGVVMGTTVGSSMNNVPFYEAYRKYMENPKENPKPSLDAMETFLSSNPSEIIADVFGLCGPRQTVVNACASGTDAIGVGAGWIKAGLCDVVIAGGCDALSRVTMNGFNSLMVMDEERCRPFDANRQGLNLGEGAAALILESDAHLQKRKAKAIAEIIGYANACDAHHLTAPHPEGRGLQSCLARAAKQGGYSEENIAFVNVHGTGTKNNDAVEGFVMGKMLPHTPFFSSKGATGHTLGAAGAIEAAFCILCLHKEMIPPTVGLLCPDPELSAHPTMATTAVKGRVALSTSLAFGGLSSVLALSLGS